MLPGAEMAGVGGAELDDDLREEVDGCRSMNHGRSGLSRGLCGPHSRCPKGLCFHGGFFLGRNILNAAQD